MIPKYQNIFKRLSDFDVDINQENEYGITPLIYFCKIGNEAIIEKKNTVKLGIDIDKENTFGTTSDKNIVKKLVEYGVNIDVKNIYVETPLMLVYKNNIESIYWKKMVISFK
ncbi:hypothetical protein PIROE2DRAFT_16780 [Piromyces sp. E2]|nr:hypothetical protein PIROE2DRAFT_16780 [Piromyces sp. E2]|eukprot:OUM58054.1 hypothetical protein PIROE2DRAFT_16780 [Piromyces sp. E2]